MVAEICVALTARECRAARVSAADRLHVSAGLTACLPGSVVVQLQPHAILNLIVRQRDVVFVDSVPLLYANFVCTRPSLGSHQLLQVTNCVIFAAHITSITHALPRRNAADVQCLMHGP